MADFHLIQRAQKQIFTFVFGISIFLLLAFFFLVSPLVNERLERRPFDSTQWKNDTTIKTEDSLRLKMVNDLFDRYQLRGMSRVKVHELLGVPPKSTLFLEYDYVYLLGVGENIIANNRKWLAIKFENDVVIDVQMIQQ